MNIDSGDLQFAYSMIDHQAVTVQEMARRLGAFRARISALETENANLKRAVTAANEDRAEMVSENQNLRGRLEAIADAALDPTVRERYKTIKQLRDAVASITRRS